MADASDYYNGNLSSAFASANRGALTTIFTPPGTCLTETTLISFLTTSDSSTDFFTTTKLFINHFSWGDPNCYPSTIATISGYTRWNNGYYYSPGICPSGWAPACQQTENALGFSTTIKSDTSIAICCPVDWTCVGGATSLAGRGCSTNLFAGQTLTSVWPAAIPTPDTSMPLPSQRMLTTWEITSNTSALCDAIPVLWQNTDIQILSLLGESTTTNVFPTSTSTSYSSTMTMAIPTATGVTSNAPEVSSRDSNMPQGAKIGIGVTIPSVLTALILGLFVYFRRRDGQQQFEDAGEELRSHTDDTDWSYLDTSRKQELPSEGLPAEMDANRETRELESLRIIHEMADTSIPGVSMRDTSNNPILRNYITDIISKPVAVAGPDILNNLIPGEESPGCRPPRNDTREIETSNSTRTIRQASTWNRDQTEAAPSLADASHYREDFSNNLSANNNNTSTAVISSTSDAHQSPPSPTTLNHYVLRSPSAREIDQGHEMSTVSPVSSGPPRWFSITSIADWSPTDSRLNNGSDEIVSPLNAGPQRRYSVAFRADPSSAVPSLPRVPQRPPSPPPVSTTPPLGLSTPTSCSSPQPQHSPPPSSNSPI